MGALRVRSEADLPPRESDVEVTWEPRLGEPIGLRRDWCAFLAGRYGQPISGVQGEPSRSFAELLADTGRENLGLWVTSPVPAGGIGADPDEAGRGSESARRSRYATFKLQTSGEEVDCAAVVDAIRREHSLAGGVQRFAFGSVPVFATGDGHVIKLFPPTQRSYFDTERAVLARIGGLLPIPTPRLLGAGERGSWLYIVMSRLAGRTMAEAWPAIEIQDRVQLMREVGGALAALHGITTDELASLAADWPAFIATQRGSSPSRQRSRGLEAPWVNEVGDFLARWTPDAVAALSLLHTEVMREHVLVEPREGTWHVTGLIDFEDALLGAPEYEFACAGIFLTCAEPGLLRVFLDAYGVEADDELPLRIMAYALLHRYSDLRWYLDRLPVPEGAGDLGSLARAWFTP